MTCSYNPTSARKLVAGIAYRLNDHEGIDRDVLRRIIAAHLRELQADLPTNKFGGVIGRLVALNDNGYNLSVEFAAGLDLLRSILPRPTYGSLTAGTTFKAPTLAHPGPYTKRKSGVELHGCIYPHPRADLPVVEVSAT